MTCELPRSFALLVNLYALAAASALALGGPFSKLAVLAVAAPLFVALAYVDVRLLVAPFVIISLAALPPFPTQAQVFGVNLYVTDFIVFIAIFVMLRGREHKFREPAGWGYAAAGLLAMVVLGVVNGAGVNAILRDARGPTYLVATFIVGARLSRKVDRKLLFSMVLVLLWYSAAAVVLASITSLPIVAGRVEPVSALVGYGSVGFGATRFLVPTTALALFSLCACLSYSIAEDGLDRSRRRQVLRVALPSAVLVFLSFSRNSLLALAAALLFTLPFATRRLRAVTVLPKLAACVILVLVALPLLGPPGKYLSTQVAAYGARVVSGITGSSLRTDTSANFRRYENKLALQSFRSSPVFGHGAGHRYRPLLYHEPFSDRDTGPTYIHNFYLWALVKGGVLGLGALLITLLQPVARAILVLRRSGAADYPLVLALCAGIVGLLVTGTVALIVHDVSSSVLLGLSGGFLSARTATYPPRDDPRFDPGRSSPPSASVPVAG